MNTSIQGAGENKKAYIKIADGGNSQMDYVKFNNIDFENNGTSKVGEISMKNSGYTNTEKGTTIVSGKLNTDSKIINKGKFEITESGEVNIKLKAIYKENRIKVWLGIILLILSIIYKTITFYNSNYKITTSNQNNQIINSDK